MNRNFIIVNNQQLELLPQKAIYWHETQTLIISDIHLGKATHFRKNGLPLPLESGIEDLRMLEALLIKYKPSRVLLLGDLFHSEWNQEWLLFGSLLKKYADVSFELVRGNHDILKIHHYDNLNIRLHEHTFIESGIVFSHEKIKVDNNQFSISGHIHPGYKLYGKGKQSLSLPCFYREQNTLIMPAFGKLTGLAHLPSTKHSEIFVISEDQVHLIKSRTRLF